MMKGAPFYREISQVIVLSVFFLLSLCLILSKHKIERGRKVGIYKFTFYPKEKSSKRIRKLVYKKLKTHILSKKKESW